MSLIVAETRKLSTVWTTTIITAVGLLLVLVGTGFLVFESELSGEFLGTDPQVAAAIDQIGGMSVIALIVGLLSVTTEFRHETIGRTFQLTPSRTRVVVSKMLVGAVYGLVFFVLGLILVAALLLVSGTDLSIGQESARAVWQGPVGLALMAVFGVAVGALLRSQVVAVALMLIYVFIIESLFMQFLPGIGRWLPFQALNAMFVTEELTGGMGAGMAAPVDPMVGLAVFVGYCLAAATSAIVLMRVRDV